ncbi:polysaccharide lyase family 8 super-sandwich domain-containing protein [Gorillibacterium sp. sgz5001074]|uniref:polysaccharide lyase family 8 super-sandwich domain-containing protein n=1 Tax=Gorillibacterium sp. sgz5001074 TaxID=3446695 RepID=UPI003F67A31E
MNNPLHRFKKWICLVMAGLMISSILLYTPASASTSEATNPSQAVTDMKLMKKRMVDYYISRDIINDGTNGRVEWTFKSQAGTYLTIQNPNGSWPDVDYASTTNSANGRAWSPYLALDRMQSMAQAFADPNDPNYRSEALLSGIKKALDYWFTVKPTSTNWWETGIGKQLRLGKIAILCEGYLTAAQLTNIIDTLDSNPHTVDGANSSWFNQNYMVRGLLLEDSQIVRNAVDAFNVLSKVTTTVTGIQSDMSFFMHGKTNYTTGYGRSFARDMSFWAYITSGTLFSFSQPAIDSLSSYLLDGTRYNVKGDVADLGMGMNGPYWPGYSSWAVTFYEDPLVWMQAANPARAPAIAQFLENIRSIGTGTSNGLDSSNITQWQTLVSSHMREDYGITVKMSSSTVKGGEWRTINPNGYNLLYWTPQGATAIQRTGDEYRTIYPLMDWAHVPGTTAPYVLTKDGNFNNPKTFVGGVTNERYGATAFDFSKLSTSGKKGYFFFDEEMVALGTGITSTNNAPIHTTMNQSQAAGEVLVDGQPIAEGTVQTNGSWAYNDNIGYVFPNKTDFQVKRETKTESWSDVVSNSSTETMTRSIFSMWLDHGVKPTNASYQYIVLPNKSSDEVSRYAGSNPISILSNTASVQAVRHQTLGIAELLFYQPDTVTVREGLTVSVDKPAMVILDESAAPVRISVTNPVTPGISVNVTLNRNGEATKTSFKLGKDTFTGRSVTLNEGASIDDSGFDLAYNKGTVASSSKVNHSASNATDIYRTSYWNSHPSDNEWIQVDLEDQYVIHKVRLKWANAFGKKYRIQVSNDAVTWTDVYATAAGDGGTDDLTFRKVSARYVRMQGAQQGNGDGYSLYEFSVYEAVAPNLAEGMPTAASSSRAADVMHGNAVDGSLTTRWGSNYSDSQWIYVDLGTSQSIQKVSLNWEAAFGKEYQIRVSDNASDWTTVYSTTTGDGGVDDISIEPVNARYVQMYGIKRGSTYGYSLWEFKVFGTEPVDQVPVRMELEAAPVSVSAGGEVTVTGAVYDSKDLPVSGVVVEWGGSSDGFNTDRSTTDGNGRFSSVLTAPPVAGEVTITATLPASPGVTAIARYTVSRTPDIPGVPQVITVEEGNGRVSLGWNPVAGASAYKVYQSVTSSTYGTEAATVTGSVYGANVAGLTNGTTYYFVVTAMNEDGESPASNQVSATPATVPEAPTNVVATTGNGQATVTFDPPAGTGGSAVTGYQVIASPGGRMVTGTANSVTMTGLSNGTTYTFTVKAMNRAGSSQASAASNAVTPSAPTTNTMEPTSPEESRNQGLEILVNGKAENIGIVTTATRGEQTVTTVAVDEKKMEAKLAAEDQGVVITIPVNSSSDAIVGEWNGLLVRALEQKQAVVVIKTKKATYTLPAQQMKINAITDAFGQDVILQDIKVQIAIGQPDAMRMKVVKASESDKLTFVVPPLDFTVKAVHGNATVELQKYSEYVERTLAIPDGIAPHKITTGVVIEPDGTLRHVPTKIINLDGQFIAQINSMTNSTYSVVWHPTEFKDVAQHWAKEAVNNLGSRMIINGVTEDLFHPDQDITRAEFTAIMVRGLGLKLDGCHAPYTDVLPSDWFSGAVLTAHSYNLIQGFEDGTFRPSEKITREQAMTIVAKAMAITKLAKKLPNRSADDMLMPYDDSQLVSAWAKEGLVAGLKAGLVTGRTESLLAPKAAISRAEAAVLIQRLLQKSDLI